MGIFVGVGDFGLTDILNQANAALTAAQNLNSALGPSKTKAQIRTTADASPVFTVSDGGPGMLAIYDPADTESADDGTSVLIGTAGKRYKLTSLQSLLLSPLG